MRCETELILHQLADKNIPLPSSPHRIDRQCFQLLIFIWKWYPFTFRLFFYRFVLFQNKGLKLDRSVLVCSTFQAISIRSFNNRFNVFKKTFFIFFFFRKDGIVLDNSVRSPGTTPIPRSRNDAHP